MPRMQDHPHRAPGPRECEIMPPDFHPAREAIRSGIAQSRAAGVADATLLAVLLAETLPRLVNAYGPAPAAAILMRIAHDIGAGIAPNCRPQ